MKIFLPVEVAGSNPGYRTVSQRMTNDILAQVLEPISGLVSDHTSTRL